MRTVSTTTLPNCQLPIFFTQDNGTHQRLHSLYHHQERRPVHAYLWNHRKHIWSPYVPCLHSTGSGILSSHPQLMMNTRDYLSLLRELRFRKEPEECGVGIHLPGLTHLPYGLIQRFRMLYQAQKCINSIFSDIFSSVFRFES